jgi:3-hydroxyisobutyrate dehydrogenase-like beta-hydroxyacid dehydrogenase
MGSFIGSTVASGYEVVWASAGRSAATRRRAQAFRDVGSLAALAQAADAVVSVCPPGVAVEVARHVADAGFDGLYVDANAVGPQTMAAVGAVLPDADVVDGAIIGGPSSDSAVLHLSGPAAERAQRLFAAEKLQTNLVGERLGAASALKACFATSTKAYSALMLAAWSAARVAGVEDALLQEWHRQDEKLVARLRRSAATVNRKAWRFGAEMAEAAGFYRELDMPDGFSAAAAAVYDRLADLPRDDADDLDLASVLDTLAARPGRSSDRP